MAANVDEGINTILRKVLYHLSKPNSDIKDSGPIRGANELGEFKNSLNQLIQNILIITQKFKEKYSDTVDPFLIRGYRENYLWLRNLAIELHRLIAPTVDLDGDNLKLAQSLGKSITDAPANLEDMIDDDDDVGIFKEYVKCPVCKENKNDTTLQTYGNKYISCPKCNAQLVVPEDEDRKLRKPPSDDTIVNNSDLINRMVISHKKTSDLIDQIRKSMPVEENKPDGTP